MALGEEGTMKIMPVVRGCILAAPLALAVWTTVPALAQGEGPFAACLQEYRGEVEAFEACLAEHAAELEASFPLPAGWRSRLHDFLQAHPEGWDRIEDIADRLEDRRDRAENARDRREDRIDAWEDRHDTETDLEDVFDRLEDRRDRAENRWDRRENVRDRLEDWWDRRH
jgi:hypothetical protein